MSWAANPTPPETHRAVSVIPTEPTLLVRLIRFPAGAYHPTKAYLLRVGVGSTKVLYGFTSMLAGDTAPPLGLNATVRELACTVKL